MDLAGEILQKAESELRALVADAAGDGDYEGVVQIASWARALADVRKETSTAEPRRATPISVAQPVSVDSGQRSRATASTVAHHRAGNEHVRFFRRGDQLIRVARSKRKKKEYQHKAPRSTIDALVAAIAETGKDGRVFTTDQVLPIRDPGDGSEIPNYQSYVCIAWLKHTGLIDQHGRQGYSIPRLAEFKDAVESIWRTLPKQ